MKALIRNRSRRGFTLIELMIVVAIIGILAVLAIYGVSRYLKSAKTAEATNNIGQLAKNAQESWTREKIAGTFVAAGQQAAIGQCLCVKAASPVPATPPVASKYVSGVTDWNGDSITGWKCLRYTIDQPQYYSYKYTSDSTCTTATPGTTFSAIAEGDLDGNGTTSHFEMVGNVDATTKQLVMAPAPLITNEAE